MSNLLGLFSSITLGVVFYLFFYWKRLREDYTSSNVFSGAFYVLLSSLIGAGLGSVVSSILPNTSFFDSSQMWFWGAILGFLLGTAVAVFKKRIRFLESVEASGMGFLVFLGFVYLTQTLIKGDNFAGFASLGVLILLGIFFFLESRYRKFTWYKSGRVGFSGLVTLGLFFLARTFIALASIDMLSLVGKLDVILSGVTAFLLFFSVYHLSESY